MRVLLLEMGVENISSRALGAGGCSAHMGFLCKAMVVTGLPPKGRADVWESSRGIWNQSW